MITKIKAIAIKAKHIPTVAKKQLTRLELGAIGAMSICGVSTGATINEVRNFKNVIQERKVISWEKAVAIQAKANKESILQKTKEALYKQQKMAVMKIMEEDANCALGIDKDKIAHQIVKFANEYKADPVVIACIAKKETHFTENLNAKSGKGMMQVTSIAIKELWQNPSGYHAKLEEITKAYGSQKEFYKAIQNKPSLNLRVGIILFQGILEKEGGNLTSALKKYNGSPNKVKYASAIMQDVKKYRAIG